MALRLVSEKSGTARIAVVGAESPSGTLLRAALADRRVPGARVNLYGAAGGEAVISEYDGEARLIQEPDLPEIVAHDFIYLCEPGDLTRQVIAAAGVNNTVVDVIGCLLPRDVNSELVHSDFAPSARADVTKGQPGYLTLPHALSITLAELLQGIEHAVGVEQGVCTVLRPAADFGQPGLEELREQTVRLLSFAEIPVETFGAQLAFNTMKSPSVLVADETGPPTEARIREELRCLLGWERQRLTLTLLTAPVFHGHGVQLHLRTRSPCKLAGLRKVLAASRFFGPPLPPSEVTPLKVASDSTIIVAEPTDDGLGGFWIWAVAGEVELRSAKLAVQLSTGGTT